MVYKGKKLYKRVSLFWIIMMFVLVACQPKVSTDPISKDTFDKESTFTTVNENDKIRMILEEITLPEDVSKSIFGANVRVENNTDQAVTVNAVLVLEKLIDGKWLVPSVPIDGVEFPADLKIIEPWKSSMFYYPLGRVLTKVENNEIIVDEGRYRLVKEVEGYGVYAVEFDFNEESIK